MITFPSNASLAVVWLFSFAIANKANVCVIRFFSTSWRSYVLFFFFDSYKE